MRTNVTTPKSRAKGRTWAQALAALRARHWTPGPPLHVIGSDGRLCVSVPLCGKQGYDHRMTVDAADWERVKATYGDRWTVLFLMGTYRYVMGTRKHRTVALARVIAGAGPDEAVRFRDGNGPNLARENLVVLGKREAIRKAGRGEALCSGMGTA